MKFGWFGIAMTALSTIAVPPVVAAQATRPADSLCNAPGLPTATDGMPPVYLMQDNSHSIYRIESSLGDAGQPAAVHRFPVSQDEILNLCSMGIDVRALPNVAGTTSSVATSGLQSPLPSSFSIFRLYGTVYGNFYIAGTRPSGTTNQWVVFDMQSTGFNGTLLHAPVVLFLDASKLSGSNPQIVGNGLIIGDVHLRTANDGGCGSSSWPQYPIYDSQIEAFWSGGNWIYGSTCDPYGAFDGTSYNWNMQANTNSWISYTKTGGGHSYSPPAVYTLSQRPSFDPNQGGILFNATNDVPGANFRLNFTNASTGWF
jgi:hypothetical protein